MREKAGIWIHVLFWAILLAPAIFFNLQLFPVWEAIAIATFRISLLSAIAYLNIFILIPRFFNRKGFFWYGVSIFLILVFMRILHTDAFLPKPEGAMIELHRISPQGENIVVRRGPEDIAFAFGLLTTFIVLFISSSYKLADDFLKKERWQLSLEKERLNSEMKFLRAQINPHFLFNALNNLYAISRIRPQKVGEFVGMLSDMLRYVIYDCNNPSVSLEKEIDYIRNYIYFQKLKEDNENITLEVQVENPDFQVEPMLFIPLIENAFKHSYDEEGDLPKIEITINQKEDELIFRCENSISNTLTTTHDPSYSGIGIKNTSARLEYAYPERHELALNQSGTFFTITLNIHGQRNS